MCDREGEGKGGEFLLCSSIGCCIICSICQVQLFKIIPPILNSKMHLAPPRVSGKELLTYISRYQIPLTDQLLREGGRVVNQSSYIRGVNTSLTRGILMPWALVSTKIPWLIRKRAGDPDYLRGKLELTSVTHLCLSFPISKLKITMLML